MYTAHRLVFVVGIALGVCQARGAFVNNVETFDGTSKDTTTWEEFTRGSAITQDGKLTLDASVDPSFGHADYTTRQVTVGVGGFVQADVTVRWKRFADLSHAKADDAWVALTTNSAGAGDVIFHDSYALSTQEEFDSFDDSGYWSGNWYQASHGSGSGNVSGHPLNHTYQLRLERLSATSVRYSATNLDGSAVWSTVGTVPANSSPLFVALVAINTITDFDNVIVGVVPEPSVAAACLGLLAIGARRNRR